MAQARRSYRCMDGYELHRLHARSDALSSALTLNNVVDSEVTRKQAVQKILLLNVEQEFQNGWADNKNEEGHKKTCKTWKSKLS